MNLRSVFPGLLIALVLCVSVVQPATPVSAAFPAMTWSPGPYLPGPNINPDAVRLADGRVLASGEYSASCAPWHRVSIYEPGTLSWTRIGGTPNAGAFGGSVATLLADGRVLVTGGRFEATGGGERQHLRPGDGLNDRCCSDEHGPD